MEKLGKLGYWLKITVLGWSMGVVLVVLLSSFFDSLGIEGLQFYVGFSMGLGVGLAQAYIFRIVVNPWKMVFISALGFGLTFGFFDLVKIQSSEYSLILSVLASSVIVSFFQSRTLSTYFANTYSWFWLSMSGWVISALLLKIIDLTMGLNMGGIMNLVFAILNLLIIISGGLVIGAFSWLSFSRMILKETKNPR